MKIRNYSSEDRDQVITLWQNIFSDDSPHNEPSKVIDAKLAIDELLFVAEDNDAIIGTAMAGYDGHRGWLYSVAVRPPTTKKRHRPAVSQACNESVKDCRLRQDQSTDSFNQ